MATPDGISAEDWDRVTELSMEIWRHINDEDAQERCRLDLLNCLDALEVKYGSLPSIVATRADFISASETPDKEELLARAYALAVERRDRINALYISHSLAEMYLDERRKPVEGRRWLACFGTLVYEDPDNPLWAKEYDRLKKLAEELESGSG
jgi:hypothetical protein